MELAIKIVSLILLALMAAFTHKLGTIMKWEQEEREKERSKNNGKE